MTFWAQIYRKDPTKIDKILEDNSEHLNSGFSESERGNQHQLVPWEFPC